LRLPGDTAVGRGERLAMGVAAAHLYVFEGDSGLRLG
jgi:hypothetical protein